MQPQLAKLAQNETMSGPSLVGSVLEEPRSPSSTLPGGEGGGGEGAEEEHGTILAALHAEHDSERRALESSLAQQQSKLRFHEERLRDIAKRLGGAQGEGEGGARDEALEGEVRELLGGDDHAVDSGPPSHEPMHEPWSGVQSRGRWSLDYMPRPGQAPDLSDQGSPGSPWSSLWGDSPAQSPLLSPQRRKTPNRSRPTSASPKVSKAAATRADEVGQIMTRSRPPQPGALLLTRSPCLYPPLSALVPTPCTVCVTGGRRPSDVTSVRGS